MPTAAPQLRDRPPRTQLRGRTGTVTRLELPRVQGFGFKYIGISQKGGLGSLGTQREYKEILGIFLWEYRGSIENQYVYGQFIL